MPNIKVMSAGAVKSMVAALGAEFERESGTTIEYNFGTAGALRDRVKRGETADLVIVSESAIAELMTLGHVFGQTVTALGRTVTGVIVREGARKPDISTPDAFKQALRDARSIAYTDPKAGGSGGIMFVGMLEKLGMLDEVNAKAVLGKGGFDVSQIVADGRAELGTTFLSEALPVKGLTIVGTLPGALHNAN
ncbi:MAG TPA: substrate-binding domain-containing protein, partial [Pseudolabrys sp.]|nr:substrate-binding domain-containing protein [Pseudolabrys sp.]